MSISAQTADTRTTEYAPLTPPRGRIVILQGRGDDPTYYKRLGNRISVDGYTAFVPAKTASSTHDVAQIWNDISEDWDDEIPVLAVTVDSAAGFLTHAIAENLLHTIPDGLILTGIALPDVSPDANTRQEADELALRSACPAHGAVVEAAIETESLVTSDVEPIKPVLPKLKDEIKARGTVPSVVIHGSDDVIAPIDQVRLLLQDWTSAEFIAVRTGLHDIINDVNHRTVAAEIISFAERLRQGTNAPLIVTRTKL